MRHPLVTRYQSVEDASPPFRYFAGTDAYQRTPMRCDRP